MHTIEHGVSAHDEDAAVHVGRVMNWPEARLDALKAREGGEDEDEDRGAGPSAKPASTLVRLKSTPALQTLASRDSVSKQIHCFRAVYLVAIRPLFSVSAALPAVVLAAGSNPVHPPLL